MGEPVIFNASHSIGVRRLIRANCIAKRSVLGGVISRGGADNRKDVVIEGDHCFSHIPATPLDDDETKLSIYV